MIYNPYAGLDVSGTLVLRYSASRSRNPSDDRRHDRPLPHPPPVAFAALLGASVLAHAQAPSTRKSRR